MEYNGYSPERRRWALKMQEKYAMNIYCYYFNADKDEIRETDKESAAGNATSKDLDFSGIDKRIKTSDGVNRHVAQRFRPGNPEYEVDFSLRFSLPESNIDREYERLMATYRKGGDYPSQYSFGIAKIRDGQNPEKEGLKFGFEYFCIMNTQILLRKIDQGLVKPDSFSDHDRANGIGALYYNLKQLRNNYCIKKEWDWEELTYIGGAV